MIEYVQFATSEEYRQYFGVTRMHDAYLHRQTIQHDQIRGGRYLGQETIGYLEKRRIHSLADLSNMSLSEFIDHKSFNVKYLLDTDNWMAANHGLFRVIDRNDMAAIVGLKTPSYEGLQTDVIPYMATGTKKMEKAAKAAIVNNVKPEKPSVRQVVRSHEIKKPAEKKKDAQDMLQQQQLYTAYDNAGAFRHFDAMNVEYLNLPGRLVETLWNNKIYTARDMSAQNVVEIVNFAIQAKVNLVTLSETLKADGIFLAGHGDEDKVWDKKFQRDASKFVTFGDIAHKEILDSWILRGRDYASHIDPDWEAKQNGTYVEPADDDLDAELGRHFFFHKRLDEKGVDVSLFDHLEMISLKTFYTDSNEYKLKYIRPETIKKLNDRDYFTARDVVGANGALQVDYWNDKREEELTEWMNANMVPTAEMIYNMSGADITVFMQASRAHFRKQNPDWKAQLERRKNVFYGDTPEHYLQHYRIPVETVEYLKHAVIAPQRDAGNSPSHVMSYDVRQTLIKHDIKNAHDMLDKTTRNLAFIPYEDLKNVRHWIVSVNGVMLREDHDFAPFNRESHDKPPFDDLYQPLKIPTLHGLQGDAKPYLENGQAAAVQSIAKITEAARQQKQHDDYRESWAELKMQQQQAPDVDPALKERFRVAYDTMIRNEIAAYVVRPDIEARRQKMAEAFGRSYTPSFLDTGSRVKTPDAPNRLFGLE